MKLARVVSQSLNNGFSYRRQSQMIRAFSTNWSSVFTDNSSQNADSSESTDNFEKRIFGGVSGESSNLFYQKLEKAERASSKSGLESNLKGGYPSGILDGLMNDGFNTLRDGMEGKLMDAASYFEWNPDEVDQDNYSFRPDMNFNPGMTYEPKDLDLTKPGVYKPDRRFEFEVTTKEALRKADFRNVRFLAKFLTKSGIIIERSKTGISAKAQRKVAREIKTARAFGLMPFTTMGTKAFQFGRTMENVDEDYEYTSFAMGDADTNQDPL